ncbi:MAG: hypothetical protein M1461_10390 [Nitrospirae bacterium]|nr:hypothetical protein [Nitrospirota bacterium]
MERVLRINRPLIIQCSRELKEEAIDTLMREIYEIGERAGVDTLEVELYKEIGSEIFFPSTNCAVNTYNTPEWIQIFESQGFACSKTTLCFEMNLGEFSGSNAHQQINIRKHALNNEEDKKLYYNLWSLSNECPYDFGNNDYWYSNVFGWPRVWYSEIAHILDRDDYILFAEKNGEAVGFIHWWPNVYPSLIKGGRRAIFVREHLVQELLDTVEEGKIFKIIVTKKAKNDKNLIERALINEALELMRNKYRFKRCQIGNIPTGEDKTLSFMQEKSGRKVHEMCLMRMRMRK